MNIASMFGILLSFLASAALLACSGGSSEDLTMVPEGSLVIEVKAEHTRFVPDMIRVPAGQTVTLLLKNLDANEHDLEVRGLWPSYIEGGGHEGHGGPISVRPLAVHAAAEKTASVTFRADQPGAYEVICTIPGHEQSGMVARLIVA